LLVQPADCMTQGKRGAAQSSLPSAFPSLPWRAGAGRDEGYEDSYQAHPLQP